jgi:hypothetical protein
MARVAADIALHRPSFVVMHAFQRWIKPKQLAPSQHRRGLNARRKDTGIDGHWALQVSLPPEDAVVRGDELGTVCLTTVKVGAR